MFTSEAKCIKKISYDSKKLASKALSILTNSQKLRRNRECDSMNIYLCDLCNKWHLGHKYRRGKTDSLTVLFDKLAEEKLKDE